MDEGEIADRLRAVIGLEWSPAAEAMVITVWVAAMALGYLLAFRLIDALLRQWSPGRPTAVFEERPLPRPASSEAA
jgi:hypothetical protein